ncbi:MAG: hypothetical protein ACLGHP_11980, partial [Vicinamibacteria bacterium]
MRLLLVTAGSRGDVEPFVALGRRAVARGHEVLITIEEGAIGGFAAQVLQDLAMAGLLDHGLKIRPMILPDRFIDHASPAR